MISKTCPDQESLQQLLLGKVPGHQAEPLEEHLLNCDRCSAVADTISAGDELTSAIRSPDFYQADDENLDRAIEQAKQLRPQSQTRETGESVIFESQPQPENASQAADELLQPGCDFGRYHIL